MNNGYHIHSKNDRTYSLFYFTVLRQMMKILAMKNRRLDELRKHMSKAYNIKAYIPSHKKTQPDIQEQNIKVRRQLLGMALCLLDEWPDRFITLSQRHKIWSSIWLRHLESGARERAQLAPFWFWIVVHDHLYRARYQPSEEEIISAVTFTKRSKGILSKSMLSRLLGVAALRRDLPI
jgi:hypothetical protein